MDLLGAFWHLLNFIAPALVVGPLAAALAKVFWRRELSGLTWLKLALRASAACAATLLLGLVLEGRDGRMSTYFVMCLACAGSLAWSLLRPR
jgi:glucose-6-phosphate-specific signal transduction histidine kinase